MTKMVGDAKYKDINEILDNNSKSLNSDIYQITSYMTLTKAKKGFILSWTGNRRNYPGISFQ